MASLPTEHVRQRLPTGGAEAVSAVERLVGVSDWVRRMRADILRVAPFSSSVLITGPTGTGKELIAAAIHAHSPRSRRPFVPVDCAMVSGALFVSHMFGHVKGAFTDASNDTLGCFRAADGGTVFLDEVGDLELEFQVRLLRVLQERTVTPLGSPTPIPVDVRVLAATNRDLPELVAAGRFRDDLYYRLKVVALHTVPLKERSEDIEILARHFQNQMRSRYGPVIGELSHRCLQCLRNHDWPGNVRELENYVEHLLIMGQEEAQADFLRAYISGPRPESRNGPSACHTRVETPLVEMGFGSKGRALTDPVASPNAATLPIRPTLQAAFGPTVPWPTLADVEREHIQKTLEHAGYNQTVAAKLLAIDRQQLIRKIKLYSLDLPIHRGRPRSQPLD